MAQLCRAISSQLRHILTIGKDLLNSNTSSTCLHNMVNFGLLLAEISFNGFRVLTALLHGTVLVGVSQTLWRWTEGATYIRQGGHHVEHWPTFLVHYIQAVMQGCSNAAERWVTLTIICVLQIFSCAYVHTVFMSSADIERLVVPLVTVELTVTRTHCRFWGEMCS